MNTKYYIISAVQAGKLGLTAIRKGNHEKGYLVNGSDLLNSPQVRDEAVEVSITEAQNFIAEL
jgi:hypothetical protein